MVAKVLEHSEQTSWDTQILILKILYQSGEGIQLPETFRQGMGCF